MQKLENQPSKNSSLCIKINVFYMENDENTTYGAGGGKNNVDTLNKRVYGSVWVCGQNAKKGRKNSCGKCQKTNAKSNGNCFKCCAYIRVYSRKRHDRMGRRWDGRCRREDQGGMRGRQPDGRVHFDGREFRKERTKCISGTFAEFTWKRIWSKKLWGNRCVFDGGDK